MASRFCLASLIACSVFVAGLSAAHGDAIFFSENFDATTVTSNLSVPAGWTSGSNSTPAGVAQNNAPAVYDPDSETYSDPRTYISTAATNYTTVDFVYEISFTVGSGGDIAFFGIGSGQPDPLFYGEPASSFYLRQSPTSFANGLTGVTIALPGGTHNEFTLADPGPGNGTYRARMQKVGNEVTIGLNPNYTGGPFVATYSATRNMATDLSFLDSTNTRLFFGTSGPLTTFDNLSITGPDPVPEIDPAGLGSVLAVIGGGFGLLERRRKRY
ncbi:MAG: hypothetical protein ACKOTB_07195 [Planctomycetia bacterium]